MSITVYIDGRPAGRFEANREILGQLESLPDQFNDAQLKETHKFYALACVRHELWVAKSTYLGSLTDA
jgi:hypothetical protein